MLLISRIAGTLERVGLRGVLEADGGLGRILEEALTVVQAKIGMMRGVRSAV